MLIGYLPSRWVIETRVARILVREGASLHATSGLAVAVPSDFYLNYSLMIDIFLAALSEDSIPYPGPQKSVCELVFVVSRGLQGHPVASPHLPLTTGRTIYIVPNFQVLARAGTGDRINGAAGPDSETNPSGFSCVKMITPVGLNDFTPSLSNGLNNIIFV